MNINLSEWKLIRKGQIDDSFVGFDGDSIFELTDGSFWHQTVYKYHYHYAYRPSVSFYYRGGHTIMVVEGMNDFVEVEEVAGEKYTIINDFRGWTGHTLFEMQNHEIWKQKEYANHYHYAYRPEATIVRVGGDYIMTVDGESVKVIRIK